jgi:hypothetical protein
MALRGSSVRIIVSSASNGHLVTNLFGRITDDRGGDKLTVKLSTEITGQSVTSDLLLLKPQENSETFIPLTQNYSVMVNGGLIDRNTGAYEDFMTGSITID